MRFLFTIILCCVFANIHSQSVFKSEIKDVAEKLLGKEIKREAKEEITENTAKRLLKEGIEETGGKYTGEALGEQVIKRAAREKVLKELEEEGIESFLDYGRRKAMKSLEKTTKSEMKEKVVKQGEAFYAKSISETKDAIVDKVRSKFLETKIAKSALQKEVNEILAKGPLELTEKELAYLLENPSQLRKFIEIKCGDSKNFQEFFIRLAMSDKDKVSKLLDNQTIRDYIKKRIRNNGEGAVHEWLMTKNFKDFLTNPKWGNDGPFLAMSLTRLVQKTENVIFKTGGGHVSASRANSAASVAFHNGLAKVIEGCNSKEELFIAVKRYAKNNLDDEAYKEFVQIFSQTFAKAV